MAQVTVHDHQGQVVASFTATDEESIAAQAHDAGAPIPISCGAGACRTCVCEVKKGAEFINREAVGPQCIDVEEGEVLTCIAAIKEDTPPEAEVELWSEHL